MHILDEAKKHFEMNCPACDKVLKANQLTIYSNTAASLLFICECGFKYIKSVNLKVAVDQIE
jgi:C4-type Zn-finger protein